jgi:5-methylcytosine-specific restriction endonuclease McrA
MRKLPRPCKDDGTPFVPKDVFELCANAICNKAHKTRVLRITDQVVEASSEYDQKAVATELHLFPRQNGIGSVTKKELKDLYTLHFVPKSQEGRKLYDKIRNSAPYGRCPLCDVGIVSTLDHHLPKDEYPILSVTPNNLIPACPGCQGKKLEHYPKTAEEQTLHPYFDDFSSKTWLVAEVVKSIPAKFKYSAVRPTDLTAISFERLKNHLVKFQLPDLFAKQAGSELSEIRFLLKRLFDAGGSVAVRTNLKERAEDLETLSKNTWKAAMYRAAAASDWFCNGGFNGT